MTDQSPTKQHGVYVTLDNIYEMVVSMKSQMDKTHSLAGDVEELQRVNKKLQAQVNMMWVTHALVLSVITARLTGAFV